MSGFMKGVMREVANFRTFVAACAAGYALVYCATNNVHGEDLVAVRWGLVFLVAIIAGRSVAHVAALGPGFKGIGKVLLTEEKPSSSPPPAGFAWTGFLIALAMIALLMAVLVAVYLSGPGPG